MAQTIRYQCVPVEQLLIEKLPDGSTAIFDQDTKSVHSLNASATVVWETCHTPSTFDDIRTALERYFGSPLNEDAAWDAIDRLEAARLIRVEGTSADAVVKTARRTILKEIAAIGGLALPLVLTMTASEQRIYAQGASSAPTTTVAPTTPAPTTTPPPTTSTTTPAPTTQRTSTSPDSPKNRVNKVRPRPALKRPPER